MEKDLNKKAFVNVEEIAQMLSIHKKTMERIIRTDETFPKPIALGERIRRWPLEDVKAWFVSKQT